MEFYSNGKLLISAEYLVLDGAKSLALPTTYGQKLIIKEDNSQTIFWESYNEKNEVWFKDKFIIADIISGQIKTDDDISKRLVQIFKSINSLNSNFLKESSGFNIKTTQNFNREWGLGTSSTLINNIANWTNIDPYKLLKLTFGGSGYDIACAQNDTPVTFQIIDGKPEIQQVNFIPKFKKHIYFVYLNQKQNSRDGIATYRNFKGDLSQTISNVNAITEQIISCENLIEFESLIENHETIISKIINQQPVKKTLFSDFNGAIKSLGAWGGDFVMVTSEEDPSNYFKEKGYDIIIPYSKMIKS